MNPANEEPVAGQPETAGAREYQRRLEKRRTVLRSLKRWELSVSVSRLVCVVLGLVAAWLSIQNRIFQPAWLTLPVALFLGLIVLHERLLRRTRRLERAVDLYRQGLERMAGQWAGKGVPGADYEPEKHLYAADLDLFGDGSLFELLCRARTRAGESRLAQWLLEPAAPDVVRARQGAAQELATRLDLREELAVLGTELRSDLHPDVLEHWARSAPRLRPLALRWVLLALAIANVVAAIGWPLFDWGWTPLVALLLVETVAQFFWRKPVAATVAGVQQASRDLDLLSELLLRIETETFSDDCLQALQKGLETHGASPGLEIRRLRTLVDFLESMRNAMFAPLGILLLWLPQVAFAIDQWRRRCGAQVVHWLEAVAELEAMASLGAHTYEHPEDVFPQLVEAPARAPVIEGQALGHPLLPLRSCVRNDIALGGTAPNAYVVSGSNMSGKSTYLRTVGSNVVLALAGAPVRARELRLSPLRLGASIQIQDSLLEGSSKFYAEITRLRQILEATEDSPPVLFLLDEILHGTNSHDRRIGAEGVLRALLDRGAIGLVTTHDLALAEIAKDPELKLENVHFEDHLEGGRIRFDYRLRPGVVERSNALDLMREVGLEV